MITDSEESRLRVLALWNCHTTSEENLKNSWYIGKLSESERKDALSVFWYSLGMKELTSELKEKVGPKLFHSKDPRRKYIEEELSKVSVIRERSLTSEPKNSDSEEINYESAKIITFPAPSTFQKQGTRLAAHSPDEEKASYELYKCNELPLFLSLQFNRVYKEIVIELDTEDDDLKSKLDKFKLELIDKNMPDLSFENGQCIHKISLKSIQFSLISPEGKALTFRKSE